ncbi:hypothetical protein [Sabulibacter ruber]|uniref:hypothetical protein n=1 Tax=Sabulibacter ruber TaxID=2811901 RepID=UPI001A966FB3|nr:hypothetical protein [Sabulibacter ruber]
MNRFLPQDASLQLLQKIQQMGLPMTYEYDRHRVILLDEQGNDQLYFRLPITLPPLQKTNEFKAQQVNYVMLLIQAGSCAMGYFENGVNLDHKVYRSYMVRKKQGKSQIKYLKTKGKSRAGSRVRLGETAEFFENINGRLQEYFREHEIHRIALSCSKTLFPFLFDSKTPTPFDKRDERIFRIPRHVHTPIYEVMMDTDRFLQRGELIYDPMHQELVDKLMPVHHPLDDIEDYFPDDEEDFSEDEEEDEGFYPGEW